MGQLSADSSSTETLYCLNSVSPRMNTSASRDQFKPIKIGEIFLVNYKSTISSIWREKMLGYLSVDIISSERWTVFQERSSRKTVGFKEQIMSKDKYPSIFWPQMETTVSNWGVFSDISQFWLGNIRSRDVFRKIEHEQKYLMDYNKQLFLERALDMRCYIITKSMCALWLRVFWIII